MIDEYAYAREHDLYVSNESCARPKLMWVDVETTGLELEDVILEVAVFVTDIWGNIIPDTIFSTLVWENSDHYSSRFDGMETFVRNMHEKSGLVEALSVEDFLSINGAQRGMLNALNSCGAGPRSLYLAGSSIHFDSGLLGKYMPEFMDTLHYRQVNVSSLKVLAEELNPAIQENPELTPQKLHRSLPDLADSIHEYVHYLDNFLFIPGDSDD